MVMLLLILILCVLLFGAGAVLAGFGWLAVTAVTLGALYALITTLGFALASLWNAAPKVPGAVAAFMRGYARILGAPIIGPAIHWRSISERRVQGERVGAVSAYLALLWSFIVGVFLSWLALFIPFLIVGGTLSSIAWPK